MCLVRDLEISLHHPTTRGRAFDDADRRQEKIGVNAGGYTILMNRYQVAFVRIKKTFILCKQDLVFE